MLDDVRIYDRALSEKEVAWLYALSAARHAGLLHPPGQLLPIRSTAIIQVTTPMPAQMQWQILTSTIRTVQEQARTIFLTRGRQLAQPRSRLPLRQGMNPTAPFNQGLVAWYLAQPWMFSGQTWYDIASGYDGVLTGLAAGNEYSGWGSTTRPGGRGELRQDGNEVTHARISVPVNTNVFTLSAWIRPTREMAASPSEYGAIVTETTTRGWFYNRYALNYYDGGNHRSTTLVIVDQWQHAVVVSHGTRVDFYLDGMFAGSETYTVSTVATWQMLGNDSDGFSFEGALDDIRMWTRALTTHEVTSVYEDSLRGSPRALREPKRLWVVGALAGLVRIIPLRTAWQAQAVRFHPVKLAPPARVQWQASTSSTISQRVLAVRTVTTPLRAMGQPRLRYAPTLGVNQQQTRRHGLLLWYMAQPWQFPGATWFDMIAGTPGAFVNMVPTDALAGWKPDTHPGGRGSMGFDGSARAIQVEASPANSGLTQFTLSAWVYPRSFGVTGKTRIVDKLGPVDFGGFYLGLTTVEGASRTVEFAVDGTQLLIAFAPDNVIDLRTWTHITVAWAGTFGAPASRCTSMGGRCIHKRAVWDKMGRGLPLMTPGTRSSLATASRSTVGLMAS